MQFCTPLLNEFVRSPISWPIPWPLGAVAWQWVVSGRFGRWLLLFFCGLMATFFSSFVAAQNASRWAGMADTVFQHLSLDEGLPQAAVTALLEDGDGFLWVGTQDGLARWDGYRFHVYRRNGQKAGNNQNNQVMADLPDTYISALFLDAQRHLWVGAVNGRLARYQPETDTFLTLPVNMGGSVHALVGDGDKGMWVASAGGLYHFSLDGKLLSVLQHDPTRSDSLPSSHVRALLRTADGWLWVATSEGVARRRDDGSYPANDSGGFERLVFPGQDLRTGPPRVRSLYQDSTGRIWIGTISRGAFWVAPGSTALQALRILHKTPADNDSINGFIETGYGQLWIGTSGQGVIEVELRNAEVNKPLQARRILHEPSVAASLAHNTILSMLRDRAGLLWLGTGRGLSRHDPSQRAVLSLFSIAGRADRLSDIDVMTIANMPYGRVWVGFAAKGIDVLAPDGERVAQLRSDATQPERALPNSRINTIIAAPSGRVYIGTEQGLYESDLAASAVEHVHLPISGNNPAVTSLLLDGDVLWMATRDGLWKLNPRQWAESRRLPLRLTDDRVLSMVRAGDGALWLGTQNGLNRFDPLSNKVEQMKPEPNRPEALDASFISSLLIDQKNRLWVATFGSGLNLLQDIRAQQKRHFRHIATQHGLPSANVNKILQDRQGSIWVSTDDGLAQIDPDKFTVRALQRADGVLMRTFWINSGVLTPEGELLFGSYSGMTVLRSESLTPWKYRPPVVLSEIRVKGQKVLINQFNGAKSRVPLLIQPDANTFMVEFSALDFSSPGRNRYAYRLDAWDSDWVETDATRRLASYTNLPPGNYRLHLRGSNRNGEWSEPELILPIQVLPHWYQTWWARVMGVLLVLVLLSLAVRLRTRVLRQRESALQLVVEQRTVQLERQQELVLATNVELVDSTEHLRQTNGQLEAALQSLHDTQMQLVQQAKIASLGTLTAGMAHEINNPANFAYVGAFNLTRELDEFHQYLLALAGPSAPPALLESLQDRFDILSASLNSISEGTARIRDLVKDLRTFSRLDEAEWKSVSIIDSLRATLNLISTQYAAQVRICTDFQASPELECWPAQLNQVFMHLIVNACQAIQCRPAHVQQAQPGCLTIRSFQIFDGGEWLVFEFEDNGVGISAHSCEHIFDPFFSTRRVGEGMGMGLSISFGIVKKHGGNIKVRSIEGEGSCFIVKLPLNLPKKV